jgi:probable rRNA maturation factor|tara:strand:- start:1179 stop:1637 length:459 start_codon:yes stop_codon:yes gene_type:complete
MIISTNSGKVVFYNPPNNQILLNISNDIDEFIAYFSVEKIDVEVSFCTAEQIKDLNYKFRKKDSETNVLSFPAESSIGIQNACCGEVIICYEVLNNEAKESSKNITNHFKHLLIHSLLHLLGYEHDKENDAILMESEEIKFLSKIGISDPYK